MSLLPCVAVDSYIGPEHSCHVQACLAREVRPGDLKTCKLAFFSTIDSPKQLSGRIFDLTKVLAFLLRVVDDDPDVNRLNILQYLAQGKPELLIIALAFTSLIIP